MSMSKSDFRALATVLGRHNAPIELVTEIAAVCERNNPQFDPGQFILQVKTAAAIRHEINKQERKEKTNG